MARLSATSLALCLFFALTGSGCSAQAPSATSDLTPVTQRRIETEIRSRYEVPPAIQVALSEPRPSDIPGYDQITVTFSGGAHNTSFDFLVSKDRKTLARLQKFDISEDLMSKIDVKGRPVRGNPNAQVTVINFDDFECPFCARMHATLFPGLLHAYGDKIKIIYRDYPLTEIHPWAMHAAVDANCLAAQNSDAYWDFADYVHGNRQEVSGHSLLEAYANLDRIAKDQGQKHQLDPAKLQACVQKQDESAVRASLAAGDKLGVDSTPTLFIDGEKTTGALPEDQLRAILDRALGQASAAAAPPAAKK